MSMTTSTQTRAAAAADAPPPDPAPTTTHYQQVADELIKQINLLTSTVPKLELSHELSANYVRRRQNVPLPFMKSTIAAVEQLSELQAVNTLDPIDARDTLQFLDAFEQVLDRTAAFQKDLRHTIRTRRALLGNDTLQIYAIAKGLARSVDGAAVAAHVENMSRDLGRGKPVKRKPAATTGGAPPS